MANGKTKYRPEYNDMARKLCLLGATDADVADFFGVAKYTIWKWRKDYPEFAEAMDAGRVVADANVVNRLYMRAIGYSYTEQKPVSAKGDVKIVEINKHMPPDVTACIFWLKNRQRHKWRDRYDYVMDEDPKEIDPESLSDKELIAAIEAGRQIERANQMTKARTKRRHELKQQSKKAKDDTS